MVRGASHELDGEVVAMRPGERDAGADVPRPGGFARVPEGRPRFVEGCGGEAIGVPAGGEPRFVAQRQALSTAQSTLGFRRPRRQVFERSGARAGDEGSVVRQLFVPEEQLVGLREALLDAPEQRVSLGQDLRVPRMRCRVRAVRLREHGVEEPASLRGRAGDQREVVRREEDGVDLADGVLLTAGQSVHLHALRGEHPVCARTSYDGDVDGDVSRPSLRGGRHARDRLRRLARFVVNQFDLGQGARGFRRREQEECFEKVALSLRVGAEHQHTPGWQV